MATVSQPSYFSRNKTVVIIHVGTNGSQVLHTNRRDPDGKCAFIQWRNEITTRCNIRAEKKTRNYDGLRFFSLVFFVNVQLSRGSSVYGYRIGSLVKRMN